VIFGNFEKLEKFTKIIVKDINNYRVPADMLDLFSILSGILKSEL